MSFIAPCKVFYHEFYPEKYGENHTFSPGSKKNDAEKWQVATEMTTAAALVTGGTSMAGAIEEVIEEVEVDGSKGWMVLAVVGKHEFSLKIHERERHKSK